MIIFTSDEILVGYIGTKYPKSKLVVVNFTASYSNIASISELATRVNKIQRPPQYAHLGMPEFMQMPEFDALYAMSVLSDIKMFEALMRIMLHDFEGDTIVIMVRRDDYRDSLMETLIKFIQQRYGVNSWIVEDYDDLDSLKESEYSSDGLLRIDDDRQKYLRLAHTGQCAMVIEPINGGGDDDVENV